MLLVLNFVVILPDKFDDVLAKFSRADTENVQFTGLFSPPFFPHHPDPAGSGRRCPSSSLPLHHRISWAEPSHQRQGKYSKLTHPPHHNLIHIFFSLAVRAGSFLLFFFFSLHSFSLNLFFLVHLLTVGSSEPSATNTNPEIKVFSIQPNEEEADF